MKRLLVVALSLVLSASISFAEVELGNRTEVPLDVSVVSSASSPDGKRLYLLTDDGKIVVLDGSGKKEGAVEVGEGYDAITVLPGEAKLLLSGKGKKSAEIVSLEIIRKIDIAGSPFKGNPDAVVAIVVFEDFQ
jgi:hypothetical protein